MMDSSLTIMIITGSIGTFLLFFSLSGFLLKVFERIKKVYYKGLNIFTLKQVNSKINTTIVSTTVTCLMLLLTIGMLSGSLSLSKVFNTDLKENNLTDYTVRIQNSLVFINDDLEAEVKENDSFKKFDNLDKNSKLSEFTNEYVFIHKYGDPKLKTKTIMKQEDINKLKEKYGSSLSLEFNVPLIKESEYKKFMELTNQEYIDIKSNEYLLLSNIEFITDAYKAHYEEKIPVIVNNISLMPGSDSIIKTAYENYNTAGNDGVIVVSDEIVNGLVVLNISLVGNFKETINEEQLSDEFYNYLTFESNFPVDYRTRINMEASSLGIKTMVIFMGLYLGITFAISSATILAIGQLSESSDNKKRYKVLRQIGADEKMVNKALFTQIAITFAFPLIVALIHSYFGLKKINSLVIAFGKIDLTSNIIITTLFMVIVYGGYFMITYICSKNIIKNN